MMDLQEHPPMEAGAIWMLPKDPLATNPIIFPAKLIRRLGKGWTAQDPWKGFRMTHRESK